MQGEVNEFMQYVKREMIKGLGDWEQRLNTAIVKSSPTGLVRADTRSPSPASAVPPSAIDTDSDDDDAPVAPPAHAIRTKATRDV
jgi:hypothetical protein